jgi:hypothetical protein
MDFRLAFRALGFGSRTRPSTTQNTTASNSNIDPDDPGDMSSLFNVPTPAEASRGMTRRFDDNLDSHESDDLGSPYNASREASLGMTRRFDNFSITNPGSRVDGQKPTAKTTSDLERLMSYGRHASLREGFGTNPSEDDFRLHSAILFETVNTGSGSSTASEIRYLPLVAKPPPPKPQPKPKPTPRVAGSFVARTRRRRFSDPGRATSPPPGEDRKWPLYVLPDTKHHIQHARACRSLSQTPITKRAPPPVSERGNNSSLPAGTVPKASRTSWPPGVVPVELFEMITRTLSPKDIRNMRLVCKEFDSKSSPTLFKEVVVPFTAELYDMIEDDASARMNKGKGKARVNDVSSDLSGFNSYEAHEDTIYCRKSGDRKEKHGLRVFQGFGPHMNKFGIRFEVTEYDLAMAPAKQSNHKQVDAYHGEYEWPPAGYPRFGRLARLESSADETPRMTAALATLVNVREIGLSIDSGLGFLGGPDRSHHDMVFDRPLPVFDEGSTAQRPHTDGATQFWSSLRQSRDTFTPSTDFAQERLLTCILDNGRGGLPTVSTNDYDAKEYDDTTLWPTIKANGILGGTDLTTPIRGVFYTTNEKKNDEPAKMHQISIPLSPVNLTEQQKQWILETGWAQSAFLDTYILALSDNPQVFHQVTKITISKISSGLLSKLDHSVFWSALPNAENVTLLVSPDWRTVGKDDASDADLPMILPSHTVSTFRGVVHRVSLLGHIKRLRVGYTDGGEYGKGLYGRNQNLMPAPIIVTEQLLDEHPDVLSLDNIEDLTLVNCWLTPQMLKYLTNLPTFASAREKFLTLDSVSLTANTKYEREDAFTIKLDGTVHEFREGSWPAIINDLAQLVQPKVPEPEIFDPRGDPTIVEQGPLPAPYKKFTFNSCGYTLLGAGIGAFDQSGLGSDDDDDNDLRSNNWHWFHRRRERIGIHMLASADAFLGKILPCMPKAEIKVLGVWGLEIGWPKGKGEEVVYDGCARGGQGRFSGCIQTA